MAPLNYTTCKSIVVYEIRPADYVNVIMIYNTPLEIKKFRLFY